MVSHWMRRSRSRSTSSMSIRRLFNIWLALILAFGAHMSSAQELRLFTARYKVQFYGLSGGILELSLRRGDAPNQYIYASRAEPSFLGSFKISEKAREHSTLVADANGVRPLAFFSDDGKKGDEEDSDIRFDRERKRLI